jgi:predicted nucleic acid-binding protein
MSDRPFFDTTILIYAVSLHPRAAIAEELLSRGGCVSVQVLNEFASVARRKLKMSWAEIIDALTAFRALCKPATSLTVEVHENALELAQRYEYNIYDALVLSAALDAGCSVLYSEDMQHGQKIGSLTIRNPFKKR